MIARARDDRLTFGAADARAASRTAQAWIEPRAEDPEAVSALAVARQRLAAGLRLVDLRRLRVFELTGALPERGTIADLLHRSTQFYNPAKERCTLRYEARDAVPLARGEQGLLVVERGGERRPAAERWWRHEAGAPAEIREGVAWLLRFGAGGPPDAARDLAILRDREHGLLCNPHWQDAHLAGGEIPLPWITAAPAASRTASNTSAARAGRTRRGPKVRARSGEPAAPGRARAARPKVGSKSRSRKAGAAKGRAQARSRRTT